MIVGGKVEDLSSFLQVSIAKPYAEFREMQNCKRLIGIKVRM